MNRRNYFHVAAALFTAKDVQQKNALHEFRPRVIALALHRWFCGCRVEITVAPDCGQVRRSDWAGTGLAWILIVGRCCCCRWNDDRSAGSSRAEDPVIPHEVCSRRRYENGEFRNKILPIKDHCGGSVAPRPFQPVQKPAIGQCRQPLGGYSGPPCIFAQPLETVAIAGVNTNVCMHTEAGDVT